MGFRKKTISILMIAALAAAAPAFAAETPPASDGMETGFWKRRWENIKSPLTTDAKYIVFAGAALTGLLLINEDQWIDETAHEITEKKLMSSFWSKTGDNYGQLYPNVLYFAGMHTYGYFTDNKRAKKRAWMMAEASLYSGITAQIFKDAVREKRPPPTDTYDSFPSGHTTSAFTFASLVQAEHGWAWGSAAYAGALLTAFQRQANNKHYLHDVVAGAAIGAAFGYGISYANRDDGRLQVMAMPAPDGAYGQLRYGF